MRYFLLLKNLTLVTCLKALSSVLAIPMKGKDVRWNIWSEGGFPQKKALHLPIFAPPWIHPLEYLAKTTTRKHSK